MKQFIFVGNLQSWKLKRDWRIDLFLLNLGLIEEQRSQVPEIQVDYIPELPELTQNSTGWRTDLPKAA
jgi:hypothetical protein